jgi:deoxyribodipyrimidine photo-lyase
MLEPMNPAPPVTRMTRLDMKGVMAQGADGARRGVNVRIDQQGPIIVWLRKDLRLADNPALAAAAATGRPVIPLYILDETPGVRPMGGASLWWLDKSLTALAAALEAIGSRLILRRGPAREVLEDLVAQARPAAVLWNRLYDAAAIDRDSAIKAWLKDAGVACESFNAGLLNEPWTVKNGSGQPYKVFTPTGARRDQLHHVHVEPAPKALAAPPSTGRAPRRWTAGTCIRPSPTGPGASTCGRPARPARWSGWTTSCPARSRTTTRSATSPASRRPRACRRTCTSARSARARSGSPPATPPSRRRPAGQVEKFLSEVGWREFNHSILFHNPDLPRRASGPEFDGFPWVRDDAAFEAWTRGETGYPIVDAGMRELWATGFMHNRVRMIVASFLVKHLLIDWREGEAWFWDTLVDADLANNVGNWQWVAGSGADAAPYFRIFNPIAQGQKFDPPAPMSAAGFLSWRTCPTP